MEIEDHYGDEQSMFYEIRNGDMIVNSTTLEIGIIDKHFTRAMVRTKSDTIDLYGWINRNGIVTKSKVYRPKNNNRSLEHMIADYNAEPIKKNFKFVTQN